MKTSKFQICLLALASVFFITLTNCTKEKITPSVSEEIASVQKDGTSSNEITTRASGPSANGQGFLKADYLEGFQTFSFHANTDKDGNVTGSWTSNWQSQNPGLGGKFQGTIDCLNILADGKTARMSGIVTHVTGDCCPYFGFYPEVGGIVWFEVQDNGEGAKASKDKFSDWWYWGEFLTTCADDWGAFLWPIDNGNIQVKP
jgi:hypothetical protein